MFKKAFIDSNIFLNFLLKEEQFYKDSKQLFIRKVMYLIDSSG